MNIMLQLVGPSKPILMILSINNHEFSLLKKFFEIYKTFVALTIEKLKKLEEQTYSKIKR